MSILRRIRNKLTRSKLEQEIDAEIRSHIEMRIADSVASGVSAEAARRDALIRFGNQMAMRERMTEEDAGMVWDALGRDLIYAARQLRRTPAFLMTALVTMILAIGANVVVFSVLNALILRPLDVPGSARLYNVVHKQSGYDNQSYPDYLDFKTRNTTFREVAAYRLQNAGLTAGNAVYHSWYCRVSGNYFDMLGVQPAQGRVFHASDEHGPNSAPYIVLSDDFWRGRLGADPAIVGTTVHINKHPFTVIGIAPAAFHGSDVFLWPDFWMPMVNAEEPAVRLAIMVPVTIMVMPVMARRRGRGRAGLPHRDEHRGPGPGAPRQPGRDPHRRSRAAAQPATAASGHCRGRAGGRASGVPGKIARHRRVSRWVIHSASPSLL